MTYRDIIEKNKKISSVPWWTELVFHYTDVMNAVSILHSHKLYSRIRVQEDHLMKNDNASKQVIDITEESIKSNVRFYFRPLTPTQYYNEGYKHPFLRYQRDLNANISVPIFFVFRLEKLLENKQVRFSNLSQAGSGAELFGGEEAFSQLDFKKIYSIGRMEDDEKKYRHAELLIPEEYSIDDSLYAIVCRNDVERMTLLNLLCKADNKAFYTYKNKIKVFKDDIFYNNGLMVKSVLFNDNKLFINFADTYNKQHYEQKMLLDNNEITSLSKLKLKVEYIWSNSQNELVRKYSEVDIDYSHPKTLETILPLVERATKIEIIIKIDNNIIACINHLLNTNEIIN